MSSSIGTGGTFSPPAVISISLIRPVIVKYPSVSTTPISPDLALYYVKTHNCLTIREVGGNSHRVNFKYISAVT